MTTEDLKRIGHGFDGIEDTKAGKALLPLANILSKHPRPTIKEAAGGGAYTVAIFGFIILAWFAWSQR